MSFACLLLASQAAAAPPANDNFANAQALSGPNVSVSGTNVQATKQSGEPYHADDQGGASIWYVWTAPNSGTYQVNTCGSNFDTLLAVYTGSAVDALVPKAFNDQSARCDDQSVLHFQAVSGTTYHFAVDGYSEGGSVPAATGNVSILVQQITSAPANNNFSSAQVLPSSTDNDVQGTNVLATKQTGEPSHAGNQGGASVWYSWVAPVSGRMKMNVCDQDFYSLFAVYTGNAVNALTPVATLPGYFECQLEFNVVQGTTYKIAVDGHSGGGGEPAETGDFRLRTHLTQPPANDNFAAARSLSGSSVDATGSNVDATAESGEPDHAEFEAFASVWYSWQAPSSGQVVIDTCGSDFDTLLAVYRGNSVGALSPVTFNDDTSICSPQSRVVFTASAGTTYKIAVDTADDTGNVSLHLSLTPLRSAAPLAQPLADKTAPQSKINKVVVDGDKATIKFGSSESGGSFKCKLDKAKYKSCHSPKTFRHLDAGKHKVKVLATDAAGNTDPTAAVKKFTIEG
jgi:hypothetical protein